MGEFNNKPDYTYSPKGKAWGVYKMSYSEKGSIGTLVETYFTKEEARLNCLELNTKVDLDDER